MTDTDSLLDALRGLLLTPRTGVLALLLVGAALHDWRTLRIPNWLTFGGMAAGLALAGLAPPVGYANVLVGLAGLAVGLAVLLPFHLARILGAGDVKLMAMVGAFLGPLPTLQATLYVFAAGGLVALGFGVTRRALFTMLANAWALARSLALATVGGYPPPRAAAPSAGRLPYAVAIGTGTLAFLVIHHPQAGF